MVLTVPGTHVLFWRTSLSRGFLKLPRAENNAVQITMQMHRLKKRRHSFFRPGFTQGNNGLVFHSFNALLTYTMRSTVSSWIEWVPRAALQGI